MTSLDPSFLHNLVQIIHQTTMQPTPTNRILILRSEASLAMGWVLQLFECAKDEQGRNARWKAWEGGWPGPKGLKNVGPLVPDLTNSSFSRRIAKQIREGYVHIEDFKTGSEEAIKLRISHSDDTHPPFIVRLSAVSPERAAEQGFEFLRVSTALNERKKLGKPTREASEGLASAVPLVRPMVEDMRKQLEKERKAHRETQEELTALKAKTMDENEKAAFPEFHLRAGASMTNQNVKAPRAATATFIDDPDDHSNSSGFSLSPPEKQSPKKQSRKESASVVPQVEVSGSETEPEDSEEDLGDESFSQKTLLAQSQDRSPPYPPPSRSKSKELSAQMLPPSVSSARSKTGSQQQRRGSSPAPVASGSKLVSPSSEASPRKNLLQNEASKSNPDSDEESRSPRKRARALKVVKPSHFPTKLSKKVQAKKRATFGDESDSSLSGTGADDSGSPPPMKKVKIDDSPPLTTKGKTKAKGKAKQRVVESESETE